MAKADVFVIIMSDWLNVLGSSSILTWRISNFCCSFLEASTDEIFETWHVQIDEPKTQISQSDCLRAVKRTIFIPKTPMVRQRGRKDSQTPSTKSMPNNSNLDYKRKLTTISLSPRIDRKFNTKSRSPSYDKMEIISIGTEEMEKDEIRKISTSSKPSLSPVNEGMFFFSLYIFLYSNWILDVQFFF